MGDDRVTEAMKVVLRTRGNNKQGMGDLHGTGALAKVFLKQNCEVVVLAEPDQEAIDFFRKMKIYHVPTDGSEGDIAFVKKYQPQCMVFNMLCNDVDYVRGFRDHTDVLVTIDDDGPAARIADLRINALYFIEDALTDPSFVPLQPAFQEQHTLHKTWREQAESILVTLGGADNYGFTPRVVEALADVPKEIEIQIILGPAFRHEAEMETALGHLSDRDYSVERDVDDMPRRMALADLTVCSAGLTIFEAACVGTPAVVVSGQPFEVQTASHLADLGFGINLGFGKDVAISTIRDAVFDLLQNPAKRIAMGQQGKRLVDGQGAMRGCMEIIRRCTIAS